MSLKVKGKTVKARTCTADEWFDALDLPKQRDQDYLLIATCIVDGGGNPVYEPEEVGKLDVTLYANLYAMTMQANRPEKAEKK